MRLLGRKYATVLDATDGELTVLKLEDCEVEGRSPVRCHREYLGHRLGARLGLAVPRTRLLVHPRYGRASAQVYLAGARPVTSSEMRALARSRVGLRILLLDLLTANSDRREDNLLLRGDTVFPIDYNVAFAYANEGARPIPIAALLMRWVGIDGALLFGTGERRMLQEELSRLEGLIADGFVRAVVAEIDPAFLRPGEAARLAREICARRSALRVAVDAWWRTSIRPLHTLWGELT